MNIFFYVDKMRSYLRAGDWDGLEEQYERVAEKLAGKTSTLKIKNIDLKPYQKELAKQLAVAIKKANKTKAKAIYFEYDLDNGWESSYFICQTYSSESEGDDEWASDWLNSVEGPSCAELAAQYDRSFDKTGMAGGINLFLIARTVAVFGRSCEKIAQDGRALCIGFHDQDPIMRIREIA